MLPFRQASLRSFGSSSSSATAASAAALIITSTSSASSTSKPQVTVTKKKVPKVMTKAQTTKAEREADEKRKEAARNLIAQATAKVEAARKLKFMSEEEAKKLREQQQQQQQQQLQQKQKQEQQQEGKEEDESLVPAAPTTASLAETNDAAAAASSGGDASLLSTEAAADALSKSTTTATNNNNAAAPLGSVIPNRVSWEDIQSRIRNASVQLSSCRPNAASEIMNGARQLIRHFELSYMFVDESRVCIAEHEDQLTVSVAIELVNAALRFAVPATSPFITGLVAFLVAAVQRGELLEPVNGGAHLLQLVHGASTVGNLRIWDDKIFSRFRVQLKQATENATVREVVALLNAIGAKELGVTRSRDGDDEFVTIASSSSANGNNNNASDAELQQNSNGVLFGSNPAGATNSAAAAAANNNKSSTSSSSSSSLIITPSRVIPRLFNACLDRVDTLVKTAVNGLRNASHNKGSTSAPQSAMLILDAVTNFADSAVATDSLMRDRLRVWILQLLEHAPAVALHGLIQAASTLRLDGVFYPALRRAYVVRNDLMPAALAKILTAVMLLPRKPFKQLKIVLVDSENEDEKLVTRTVFLEPWGDSNDNKTSTLTVADLQALARRHLLVSKFNRNDPMLAGISEQMVIVAIECGDGDAAAAGGKKNSKSNNVLFDLNNNSSKDSKQAENKNVLSKIFAAHSTAGGAATITVKIGSPVAPEENAAADDADEENGGNSSAKISDETGGLNSSPSTSSSSITNADALLFEISQRIIDEDNSEIVHRTPSSIATDLGAFLAGAIATQLTAHVAVRYAAEFFYSKLLGLQSEEEQRLLLLSSKQVERPADTEVDENNRHLFVNDPVARLTGELEFLALAPHFRSKGETRHLLEHILSQVQSKVRDADMRSRARLLTANQLRLLCCSSLAVKFDLPVNVATFVLANLVELAGETSLADISAVLYTVGRTGIMVPDASHTAIARRVATILKFAKASRRFAVATAGAGGAAGGGSGAPAAAAGGAVPARSLRGGGNASPGSTAALGELTAHDLAVTLSGLHLTKFRWESHPSLFTELASAISIRKKRYTPAQCCQIVAISRDIARTSQIRSRNQPQQQQQQNPATDGTNSNNGAAAATAMMMHNNNNSSAAFLATEATKLARIFLPQIRMSIPSATDADLLPLLTWLSTGHIRDVTLLDLIVDRLLQVRAPPQVCMSVLESVHAMGLLGGMSSDGVFRLVEMIRPHADADQAAQLAFFATQLRSRDVDLIKMLVRRATTQSGSCNSTKSLCSAIGALSVVQVPWNSPEMRSLVSRLEAVISEQVRLDQQIEEEAAAAAKAQNIAQATAATATTPDTLDNDKLPTMPRDVSTPPVGKSAREIEEEAQRNPAENEKLRQLVGGNNNNNNNTAANEKQKLQQQLQQQQQQNREIDVECIVSAMTAIAANEATPAAQRTRFLNRLCSILDAQLSQLPALRSQQLAKLGGTTSPEQQQQNNSLRATIASTSTRALPISQLTTMMTEVAVQNLPVFSVFRTCGKCFVAPGAAQFMTPQDAVKALTAYAAFGFRDDYVIRALASRCFALRSSIVKSPVLARQCSDAMAAFHISFEDGKSGERKH